MDTSTEGTILEPLQSLTAQKISTIKVTVNTIPPEVLGAIFAYASAGGPGESWRKIQHILEVALVCREWYQVVLSEREIWTAFRVNLGTLTDAKLKVAVPIVRRWYSRAGDLPVEMCLEVHSTDDHSPVAVESLVDFILSVDRMKDLSISAMDFLHTCSFMNLLLNKAASVDGSRTLLKTLRHFDLYAGIGGPFSLRAEHISRLATVSPSLTMICFFVPDLQGIEPFTAAFSLHKHLTHLSLWCAWLSEDSEGFFLACLLANLPALQSLRFDGTAYSPLTAAVYNNFVTHPNFATHPKITTLDIAFRFNHFSAVPQLATLQLPALEECKIGYQCMGERMGDSANQAYDHVKRFLEGCRCLTKLSLRGIELTSEDMYRILAALRLLQNLHLEENLHPEDRTQHMVRSIWSEGALFDTLFQRSQVEELLPRLQAVEIRARTHSEERLLESFTRFVEDPQRWPESQASVIVARTRTFAKLETAVYVGLRVGRTKHVCLYKRGPK